MSKFVVLTAVLSGLMALPALAQSRLEAPGSFNPTIGQKATLKVFPPAVGAGTVVILGPDREVIRRIAFQSTSACVSQGCQVVWDGRDSGGRIVPNEAYLPIAEFRGAGNTETLDSSSFSGGEFGDIVRGQISRRANTLTYSLSQSSRVLIRAGVPGSALLRTITDWQPRPAGESTEYWDGKDQDGLIDVLDQKNHTIIITYMTLPDHSILTTGNDKTTYRQFRTLLKTPPAVVPWPPLKNARKVSPHFTKSRLDDRSLHLTIEFPELDKTARATDVPVAKDKVLVRINLDPADRHIVAAQQFEIILFVDTVFHGEEERGYLPFNYPLELKDLAPGEHIITVNMITFGDQIGIGSRKIRVK